MHTDRPHLEGLDRLERVYSIEKSIKFIFSLDKMTETDVRIGINLISEWKILTNWRSDTTPALNDEGMKRLNNFLNRQFENI